jgi:hypothetical protein
MKATRNTVTVCLFLIFLNFWSFNRDLNLSGGLNGMTSKLKDFDMNKFNTLLEKNGPNKCF